MTERLINKGTNGELWVSDTDYTRSKGKLKAVMEKLYKYETAEEQGRLVVLPKCNIGDTVYIPIDFQNKIYTGTIEGFEYARMRDTWVVKIRTDDAGTCYEAFEDFGKTIFLIREEAEKALKEMEKDE